jgi:hypothetical protein
MKDESKKGIFDVLSPEQMLEILELGPEAFFTSLREEIAAGIRHQRNITALKKEAENDAAQAETEQPLVIDATGQLIRSKDAPKKRKMSAAARKRIGDAQRKRWREKKAEESAIPKQVWRDRKKKS